MKRQRLIEARKSTGLSSKQLAQQLGISKAMVVSLENCHCNPSWEVAQRLEQFFGIPASQLLVVDYEQDRRTGTQPENVI
ncbi:helix-turn-helix transcriptional regulator [Neomoorella thermoacetica]|nr:helix-turn-helix transcriptional regulator [Moorella thermoacetica]